MKAVNDNNIKRTSYLAIASIVCVLAAILAEILFALLIVCGLDGGIFVLASMYLFYGAASLGIIAIVVITIRRKISKGYFCAVLALILSAPFLLFDYGIRLQAEVREKRRREWTGLYNLEVLGKELIRYAKVHEGCLPVAERWCDLLIEHNQNLTEEDFRHPKPGIFRLKGESHFAFNKNLSGMRLADIPDDVVLIFEADGDWNLNGTGELLKTRYREKGCIAMLLVDQTVSNYWYYMQAMRKFDPKGTYMYYEKPRWKP